MAAGQGGDGFRDGMMVVSLGGGSRLVLLLSIGELEPCRSYEQRNCCQQVLFALWSDEAGWPSHHAWDNNVYVLVVFESGNYIQAGIAGVGELCWRSR